MIYIITTGEYSDYTICAATTDEETAKILQRTYSDELDDARIEEFEDSGCNEVVKVYFIYYPRYDLVISCACNKKEAIEVSKDGEINYVVVYAENKDKARKIAQDRIAKYKAKEADISF